MNWIKEEDILLNIKEPLLKTPMKSIVCYFVFVNIKEHIEKVAKETLLLSEDSCQTINKSKVLQMIQQQKTVFKDNKYIYKDAFLHLVDLDHDDLQPFNNEFDTLYSDSDSGSEDDSKDDNDGEGEEITENQEKIIKRFFKPLPLLEDIKIQPSLSIFHKYNCLYFFFHEHEKKVFAPKPLLKIHNEDTEKKKSNKKVTIKLHDIDNNNTNVKHKFTRKHR
jgi:hypothetical protein